MPPPNAPPSWRLWVWPNLVNSLCLKIMHGDVPKYSSYRLSLNFSSIMLRMYDDRSVNRRTKFCSIGQKTASAVYNFLSTFLWCYLFWKTFKAIYERYNAGMYRAGLQPSLQPSLFNWCRITTQQTRQIYRQKLLQNNPKSINNALSAHAW